MICDNEPVTQGKGHNLPLLSTIALALMLFGNSTPGQKAHQSADAAEDRELIRCLWSTALIMVRVVVSDDQGTLASGLTRTEFLILENGNKQQIAYFERRTDDERGTPYYEIGYYPGNKNEDGDFREISVRVRRGAARQLKVSSEPIGYFAPIFKPELDSP